MTCWKKLKGKCETALFFLNNRIWAQLGEFKAGDYLCTFIKYRMDVRYQERIFFKLHTNNITDNNCSRSKPPFLALRSMPEPVPPRASVSVIVCLARTFPVSSRDGAAVDVDKKWPAAAPDGRFPLPPPSAAFGGGPVRPSGRRPRFLHVQFGGGKRRGGIEERRHRRGRRERKKERKALLRFPPSEK